MLVGEFLPFVGVEKRGVIFEQGEAGLLQQVRAAIINLQLFLSDRQKNILLFKKKCRAQNRTRTSKPTSSDLRMAA